MLDREVMRMPGWRGGDGDAAYLDKTLRHEEIEHKLDETVTWRVILQLFAQAFIVSLVAFAIISVVSIFLLLFFFMAGAPEMGFLIFWILELLVGAVFFVVLLWSRLVEPIAEWRVLLGDRQDHAEAVYSKIAGTLQRRAIPIRPGYRRVYNGFGQNSISNRLMLKDGIYDAYVSVFRYGTSLYLGWMMWRSRRGYLLIKQYLVDLALGIIGRNDPESQMLRTERPRAMREAVHAACREGLVTAVEGSRVPLEFGFPHGLPPVSGLGGMPQVPRQASPFAERPGMPNAPAGGGHRSESQQPPHHPGPGGPPQGPGRPAAPGGQSGSEGRSGQEAPGDDPERGQTPPR